MLESMDAAQDFIKKRICGCSAGFFKEKNLWMQAGQVIRQRSSRYRNKSSMSGCPDPSYFPQAPDLHDLSDWK